MALIGNCTITSGSYHKQDGSTFTSSSYTDMYVIVKQIEIEFGYKSGEYNPDTDILTPIKSNAVSYQIAGYTDKETRDTDQENWEWWGTEHLPNYIHSASLYEQCYNDIKTLDGMENLTNE